jgi:hypothetical protein
MPKGVATLQKKRRLYTECPRGVATGLHGARLAVDAVATASTSSPRSDACPVCRVGRMQVQETWFAQRTARESRVPCSSVTRRKGGETRCVLPLSDVLPCGLTGEVRPEVAGVCPRQGTRPGQRRLPTHAGIRARALKSLAGMPCKTTSSRDLASRPPLRSDQSP